MSEDFALYMVCHGLNRPYTFHNHMTIVYGRYRMTSTNNYVRVAKRVQKHA